MFFAFCVTTMRICLFPLISLFQHICYLSFQVVFLLHLKLKVAILIVYLFPKVQLKSTLQVTNETSFMAFLCAWSRKEEN